jgi:hypothetical protein
MAGRDQGPADLDLVRDEHPLAVSERRLRAAAAPLQQVC